MTPDAMRARWRTRGANAPFYAEMAFEGDALFLGAGTALAKGASAASGGTDDVGSPDNTRLVALLSAAHHRLVAPRSIAHFRRAVAKRREGDTTLALIHLALSGVAKLARPIEDARRLFVADELIKAGMAPNVVRKVLIGFVGSLDDLERDYNPNQPRVPAGNGRVSGQWTSDDWASTSANASARSTDGSGENQKQPQRRIQIADNSGDWAQYATSVGHADVPSTANVVSRPTQLSFATTKKKKDQCISLCTDLSLPTTDYSISFRRCMLACMSDGNSGFPEWDKHF